jgi:hypothetical protein
VGTAARCHALAELLFEVAEHGLREAGIEQQAQ